MTGIASATKSSLRPGPQGPQGDPGEGGGEAFPVGSVLVDTNASGSVASGLNTESTGGDGAHNNLPPYIVVYMWKRTA